MNLPILRLPEDGEGTLIERKNRFLGIVDIDIPQKEKKVFVHIHDSGRLPDLLYPGNRVKLERKDYPSRKTKWDIVQAADRGHWILTHSGYHSKIAKTLLERGFITYIKDIEIIKPEPKVKNGRLDFLVQTKSKEIWIEVKGCTLKKGNIALFPDAPTKRGQKHIKNLISLKKEGKNVALIFLVLRPDVRCFSPNREIDPIFYKLFTELMKNHINIHPILLRIQRGFLYYQKEIPICL